MAEILGSMQKYFLHILQNLSKKCVTVEKNLSEVKMAKFRQINFVGTFCEIRNIYSVYENFVTNLAMYIFLLCCV